MYQGCISRLVVVRYLEMPHVRHMCVLLPLLKPHVRHAYLGIHIAVSLKGRTTHIWSFSLVLLVLLQWDVLGSDYYLVQLLFYNYRL